MNDENNPASVAKLLAWRARVITALAGTTGWMRARAEEELDDVEERLRALGVEPDGRGPPHQSG